MQAGECRFDPSRSGSASICSSDHFNAGCAKNRCADHGGTDRAYFHTVRRRTIDVYVVLGNVVASCIGAVDRRHWWVVLRPIRPTATEVVEHAAVFIILNNVIDVSITNIFVSIVVYSEEMTQHLQKCYFYIVVVPEKEQCI